MGNHAAPDRIIVYSQQFALAMLDVAPAQAFALIGAARGRPVPDTDAQRAWVGRFTAAWPWLLETDEHR